MSYAIKQVDLACPYCDEHMAVTRPSDDGPLSCQGCGIRFQFIGARPSFIDEIRCPSLSTWQRQHLREQQNPPLLGIPRTRLHLLAAILRPPRINLRRGPHLELLSGLHQRGPFKALFIGHNQPFAKTLRKDVIQLNVVPAEHVDVVAMGEHLPFAAGSFELVVLSGVIEHTQSPFQVVDEAYRVLKPMGKLYISSPWVYPFHGGDNYRFSHEGLKLLCHRFGDFQTGSLNGGLHSLAIFLITLISDALSFGNRYIRYALGLLMGWIVLPLIVLDALINQREKSSYNLDANIFIVATKRPVAAAAPEN